MNGELNRHRATGYPRRIVCLTEETTETLYLLGEEARIVGVSGYTVRPREARSKPRVSAFTSARLDRIEQLSPDLVLAFSDLQADIAAELIRRGLTVLAFNQRSVGEILQVIRTLADLVGASEKGRTLVSELASGLEAIEASARRFPRRPRVFFEEWKDPLISGIQWVEELVELAGGQTDLSGASPQAAGAGSDCGSRGGALPRPGSHHRLLVRGQGQQGPDQATSRLVGDGRRPPRADLRDQIDLHPAARAGRADGGPAAAPPHPGPCQRH